MKRRWIAKPDEVLPDAYIPRTNGKDDNGLSVRIVESDADEDIKSEAKDFAGAFNPAYGIALLTTERVRAIDDCLDVVRDYSRHALITGVPRPDHDPAKAERLAGQLARVSSLISYQ